MEHTTLPLAVKAPTSASDRARAALNRRVFEPCISRQQGRGCEALEAELLLHSTTIDGARRTRPSKNIGARQARAASIRRPLCLAQCLCRLCYDPKLARVAVFVRAFMIRALGPSRPVAAVLAGEGGVFPCKPAHTCIPHQAPVELPVQRCARVWS